MSETPVSDEQREQWERLANDVAGQFAQGRTPAEVAEMLVEQGWPHDSARDFVSHVHAQWEAWARSPEGQAALASGPSIDLSEKFPNLRTIRRPPSLFTVNGIGLSVCGARDHDPETGSDIKTHCVCFVFVPVFALGAYRVVKPPQGGGWYFLGREPLSTFAKAWNALLVLLFVSAIGVVAWQAHVSSPEHQAKLRLDQAERAIAAGELDKGARLLADVAQGRTSHASRAADVFSRLLTQTGDSTLSDEALESVFRSAAQIQHSRGGLVGAFDFAEQTAKQRAAGSLAGALRIVRAAGPLAPDQASRLAGELIVAHGGGLAFPQREEAYRIAVEIATTPEGRKALFASGRARAGQLADADLSQGIAILAVVAPLAAADEANQALGELLSNRFDKLTSGAAQRTLDAGWKHMPANARLALARSAIDWTTAHPDAAPRDALRLVDVVREADGELAAELGRVRRRLLDTLVAADPTDADAALRLALLLEPEGETDRIVELLGPHRETLGDGEGPRVLGQALARQGQFDESYALLQPWVEQRLAAMRAAESAYTNRIQQLQQAAIADLQRGTVADFNYARYQRSTDGEKEAMVREHLNARLVADPSIASAREDLVRKAAIVPVALDLGIVTLRRAQGLADPEARRAHLQNAEATFLAVRGVAGDDDRYRLFLGQVYFWLGRQDEGRKLFDELLENQGRSYAMLTQLAAVLRDIGEFRDVRQLLEEAHEKGATPEEKHSAAYTRAITPVDLDDQIAWLNRSNPRDPEVQASLASSLGDQAARKSDDAEAARRYRDAIAVYRRLPESPSSLNNGAIVFVALYAVTGERAALDEGILWLQKAAALTPGDPIVLYNLAARLIESGLAEVAGDAIDLRRLQMRSQTAALDALATDAAQHEELRRRFRENPAIVRARDTLEKTLILAPKNAGVYRLAIAIHGYTNEEGPLRELAERLAAADIDRSESIAETLKAYAAPRPDEAERWTRSVALFEGLTSELRSAGRKADFALAVRQLNRLRMHPIDAQTPVDADQLVQLAEEAYAGMPSITARRAMIDALSFRGNRALADADPAWQDRLAQCQRLLDARTLAAIALGRDDALGQAARENADLRRAADLTAALMAEFPDTGDPLDWSLLRRTHPEAAVKLAERLTQSEPFRNTWAIGRQLNPVNAVLAVEDYWLRLAAGDEAGARASLTESMGAGVPLPQGLLD